MEWLTRREKQGLVVLVLFFSFWGYWIERVLGAVVAAVATVVVAGVLYFGLKRGLSQTDVNRWFVGVGAVLLFAWFAGLQYDILPLDGVTVERIAILASSLVVGVGVGYAGGSDALTGLVYAVLTGGVTGVLLVFIAVQAAFSVQPNLEMVVVWVILLGPPVFGFVVGIGGAVGGALQSKRVARTMRGEST